MSYDAMPAVQSDDVLDNDDDVIDEEMDNCIESFENITQRLKAAIVDGEPVKGVSKKLVDMLQSDDGNTMLNYLGEQVEESDEALSDMFFSEFVVSLETISLADLLASADLQEQFSVDPARVSTILSDKDTGVLSRQALLNPPQLYEDFETGELKLASGFHRTAALSLLLSLTEAPYESVMSQRVPCLVYRFNTELVTSAARAGELVAALWLSGNMTRRPSVSEKSHYSLVKSGIRTYDEESIKLSSVYTVNEKFAHLLSYRCLTIGFTQRTGFPVGPKPLAISPALSNGSSNVTTTPDTILSIARSLLVNIKKVNETVVDPSTGKERKVALYKKDVEDFDTLQNWIEWIVTPSTATGRTPLETAITQTLLNVEEGNISRSASKIGAALANILAEQVKPRFKTTTQAKQKGRSKSGLTFIRR